MEAKIADIHVQLKKQDPKLLFQFTRSSDFRIVKCRAMQDLDGKLSKSVACVVEHGNDKTQPFPDTILNAFFTFSKPVELNEFTYETSIKGLPSRKLIIHTKKGKFYATTEIGGHGNAIILGVHVSIDYPSKGPPFLRGILLVGLKKETASYVSESLAVGPYLRDIAGLFGEYVKDLAKGK
jgi:hypothetical protein